MIYPDKDKDAGRPQVCVGVGLCVGVCRGVRDKQDTGLGGTYGKLSY
jgi:hypothetical protein